MSSITSFLKPYLDKITEVLARARKVDTSNSLTPAELQNQIETDKQSLRDFFDEGIIDASEFYEGLDELEKREKELKTPYQVYADACIFDAEGRILLLRRTPMDDFCPDCWSLPGGKVEIGESPDQAVLREVVEEIGINLYSIEKVCERKINNGEIHYYRFYLTEFPEIILDANEHLNWKFVNWDEMEQLPLIFDLKDVLNDLFKPKSLVVEKAEQKWTTKQELKELAKHAKNTSHENLERVIKEHPDPTIRTQAHQEIARREEEEGNKDSLKGHKAHEYHGKDFKYDKETDSYVNEEDGTKANKAKLHEYNTMKHAELTNDLESITKELSESTKQRDSLKNKLVKEYYSKVKKSRFVGTSSRDEAQNVAKVKLEKMGLVEEDIDIDRLNKILDSKFKNN